MSSLGIHLLHGACPLTWLFNLSALILHTKTLLKRKKKKKNPLYKWGYWSPRKLTNLLKFIQWLVGGYPRLSNFITYPLISHQTIKPFSDKLSEQWDYIENWCLDLPHTLQLFLKHHFFFFFQLHEVNSNLLWALFWEEETTSLNTYVYLINGFPGGSALENLPTMQEMWLRFLSWEDPLVEGTATHSSILAWRIPWTEEPGGLQSIGLQRVGHDWVSTHVL